MLIMNLFTLLFGLSILFAIYKLLALSLKRYERLKAMQRLEGAELIAYLGTAEPEEKSPNESKWWLMRTAAVGIACGISVCLVPLFEPLIKDSSFSDMLEVLFIGTILFLGFLSLLIELIIEHKLRK